MLHFIDFICVIFLLKIFPFQFSIIGILFKKFKQILPNILLGITKNICTLQNLFWRFSGKSPLINSAMVI